MLPSIAWEYGEKARQSDARRGNQRSSVGGGSGCGRGRRKSQYMDNYLHSLVVTHADSCLNQWGIFSAVAAGAGYAFSPLYRGLTFQFKVYDSKPARIERVVVNTGMSQISADVGHDGRQHDRGRPEVTAT